jgi:lipopolysaccharide transport system permease protein
MSARSIFRKPTLLPVVFRFRWLLYELVLRDLRLRYRGSPIGFAWTLLNPLLFAGVYVLIFGVFLRVGLPHFALYLLCGLLPWNWFSGAVTQGTTAILDGRNYVGKTIFPTEALIVVPVLSYAVNFLFSLPLLAIVMAFDHVVPPLAALAIVPMVILVQAALTLAVLFFCATINVFYRDFVQLIGYALLILFYLVPIVYPRDRIPAGLGGVLLANPLAIVIGAYQDIFYYGRTPSLAEIVFAAACAAVLLAAGHAFFARHRETLGEFV